MGELKEAPARLRMRSTPEDFRVVEEPLYPPTGDGKHTFLYVEKRGRTTEQVARDLGQESGVSSRDVGYAGRKDRHAVTRQWFSLEGVDPERAREFELTDAVVLEAHRHEHKIRTGHLRCNLFEIVLRSDDAIDVAAVKDQAAMLVSRGMPNRFGDQRFGRDGQNAQRAREILYSGKPQKDRRAARFLISALQSEVFNAVLEERINEIDGVILGDVARVEESGGLFWVDDVERDAARAKAFEISATGPIFGKKMRVPTEHAASLEAAVWERFDLPPVEELKLPRGVRARGTRRPLRIRPEGLSVESVDDETGLKITCALPPGAYVTVLLDALVGPVEDVSRPPRHSREGDAGVSSD